jgi:FAD dependent oxidoreductase TIGR03364
MNTLANRADVIVIGAGTLGTFHAYYAARKGYKTLLLERNAFPNDASTRNFGMVVQTIVPVDGEWATYTRDSRETYLRLQRDYQLPVRQTGSLYIASTEIEQRVLQEFVQAYSDTYHCIYIEADEAVRRHPFLHASYCRGALLFPDDLAVEPRFLLKTLLPQLVKEQLIDYRPQTTVVSVQRQGLHCVVEDAAGNVFTSDTVFVCSGADYRTLFPEFFTRSGLRICKLQMLQTVVQPRQVLPHSILSGLSIQRYPGFASCPSYPLLSEQERDEDIRAYGIHLLFKQAVDGSIIIGDSHEYSSFEDAMRGEEYTNCAINDAIVRYGQRMLDLPTWDMQLLWNGYYLLHPEREVYTERIDESIHIVTGIAGKGMSTGPGFSRANVNAVLR